MLKLIKELRRRSVFRSAGIYVAAAWIVIEAASVVLPTFDIDDGALRWLVVAAFIGFPIVIVLAWFFDITDQGVLHADDVDTNVRPFIGGRKADFIAIGGLSIALAFSMFLNLRSATDVTVEPVAISIVISEFTNSTDEPLFDGVLQHALAVDLENSSLITVFNEHAVPEENNSITATGSIETSKDTYRIGITLRDHDGETLLRGEKEAQSQTDVWRAIAELATDVRAHFGDNDDGHFFASTALAAAQHYISANDHAEAGNDEQALEGYLQAIATDPNYGRAYLAGSISAAKLGDFAQADALWARAQVLIESLTDRERLRALGHYQANVTHDYEQAVHQFTALVESYPGDIVAREELAASALLALDFTRASELLSGLLTLFPENEEFRSRYALSALYAGDFDTAIAQASAVPDQSSDESPDADTRVATLALAAAATEQFGNSRDTYSMAAETDSATLQALAAIGLSDLDFHQGAFESARARLHDYIASANEQGEQPTAAKLLLARLLLADGRQEGANRTAANALQFANNDAQRASAAMIFLATGDDTQAQAIATALTQRRQAYSRAYGLMLQGIAFRNQQATLESLDTMLAAIDIADLWLIRLQLGQTYLAAGQFVEALDEFTVLEQRRGEALMAAFDGTPSFHNLATLPYWTARAQAGLNMHEAAAENYQAFLARWSTAGPMTDDAKAYLQQSSASR